MATIEYVYSAYSAFAYIGSKAFMEIAKKAGATVIHKPILLSPVMAAQAAEPAGKRPKTYGNYFFGREIERWAEYRDIPIVNHIPTHHSADYSLASGMIIALGETGPAVDAMAHALLAAHWADDIDLSDQEALAKVATECGHDPIQLLEQAGSEEVQNKFKANTEWAIAHNVFGSPTYFVDGDPFYGQDHLELVQRALEKPFSAPNFIRP